MAEAGGVAGQVVRGGSGRAEDYGKMLSEG